MVVPLAVLRHSQTSSNQQQERPFETECVCHRKSSAFVYCDPLAMPENLAVSRWHWILSHVLPACLAANVDGFMAASEQN